MTPDVNVFLIDMNNNEAVTHNEDGSYSVFINARLSNDGQLKAYEHAMRHIRESDFQKENVQTIEVAAHGISIPDNAPKIPAEKYLEQIKRLQRQQRRLQRQMKKNEEKVRFLQEHANLFAIGEYQKLYGDDL